MKFLRNIKARTILDQMKSEQLRQETSTRQITKYILIIKANEMQYFSNLFDKVLYMFRTCPLFIIRSISTLYTQQ
jgi:hypothetical protein